MRLDAMTLQRVDAWREQQDDEPSRSEAIRRLVEIGLHGRSKHGFQLSNPEKLTTWLLTEILRTQKNYDNADTVKLIQEAIYGGHFWALQWEMTGVLHDHVDNPANVSFVVDVLDMWDFIETAYAGFSAEQKQTLAAAVRYRGENPKFPGFDGNNEGEFMSIANFLVRDMNRFSIFKERGLNSHMPMVQRYRQMFALFEPMRAKLIGRGLGVDELIQLLQIS